MNKQELYELLNSEMYRLEPSSEYHRLKRIDSEPVIAVFDELSEKLGRLPIREEYVQECLIRTEKYVEKLTLKEKSRRKKHRSEKKLLLRWNNDTKKEVRNIAEKAYTSFVIEYATVIQLKDLYPEAKIVTSFSIDHTFGADIVLYLDNKVIYLHIMSRSDNSIKAFERKSKTPGRAESRKNIIHYWKRDWSEGHVQLRYVRKDHNRMNIVNGNPIFEEVFLKKTVNEALSDRNKHERTDIKGKKTSIEAFIDWCNTRDIDYKKHMMVL